MIGQNTEESPGDLRRVAITQTPVRSHQLTLVWKILIIIIIIIIAATAAAAVAAAQNNATMTNYVNVRIDKTQQKSKCSLYGDSDKVINPTISECNKLAQWEYKTRYDWVGKVICWEFCKKSKFDYTNQWYMHNPESLLENETHKLLWDFEIQTEHLISARQPHQVIVNKNK